MEVVNKLRSASVNLIRMLLLLLLLLLLPPRIELVSIQPLDIGSGVVAFICVCWTKMDCF